MLTHEHLLSIASYDAATGLMHWTARRSGVKAGKQIGVVKANGYLGVQISGKGYLVHRLAWFYVHGEWPTDEIDHINRVITDNRLCNLRQATSQQNKQNRGVFRTSSTGVRGVTWLDQDRCYQATIQVNMRRIHLGRFKEFSAATKARQTAEDLYFSAVK